MSVANLDKIFQPKSIAVVGASERKGSVGASIMRNLLDRGFSGEIYPINPNHKKIGKLPACPLIRDLEIPVDLAVISTPIYANRLRSSYCAGSAAGIGTGEEDAWCCPCHYRQKSQGG